MGTCSHPSHATIGIVDNGKKLVPFPLILLSWHTSLVLKENVSFAGPPDSHIDVVSSQLCLLAGRIFFDLLVHISNDDYSVQLAVPFVQLSRIQFFLTRTVRDTEYP